MAMFNLGHSHGTTFQGGNYTQVNNIQNFNQQQTPWERLQSAAAPSAFHDAGDTFDAPKCHVNTRVAIRNELHDFALRKGETGHAKILWLNGPAGAGKSAIARSLCEECAAERSLLASFFFSRSDASRNGHKSFVATIAYQIFGYIPQHNQSLILVAIERDPLIFTRSLDAQFQALVVEPLQDLFENGHFTTIGRCLIVADGLDECSTAAAQLNILRTIQKAINRMRFPFIFLIASRPENELQTFFRSSSMTPLLRSLQLDDSYDPDVDIERFLVDKLQDVRDTHPLRRFIPDQWPSADSIRALVYKSSGQFAYASVVVKYVTSTRHQPHKRLDYVINLCPPKGDLPFAELDALYTHILSSLEDHSDLALCIIGYTISSSNSFTIEELAHIMQVDPDDCHVALCDLWSILSLQTYEDGDHLIRILHKSFPDYLFDTSRSGKYHINEIQVLSRLMANCFTYISDVTYTPDRLKTCDAIIALWYNHSPQLISSISSCHEDLMSFSLINCYNTFAHHSTQSSEMPIIFKDIFWDFFPSLLNELHPLIGSEYGYLYHHHFSELQKFIKQHPDTYQLPPSNYEYDKAVTLITFLILTNQSHSEMLPKVLESILNLLPSPSPGMAITLDMLPQFIGNLITDAAMQCLEFLDCSINWSSVTAVLTYLVWALPYAAVSLELDTACDAQKLSVYAAISGADSLFYLMYKVSTVMQEYRERCQKKD